MVETSLTKLLSCLYTDFLMLQDGSWEPDYDSCDASLEIIEEIADELDLDIVDTRDHDN